MAVLGLCCCVLAFSICGGGWGPPFLWCAALSLRWLVLLQSLGSRHAWASVVVSHGLSSCGSLALECRLSSCGARA